MRLTYVLPMAHIDTESVFLKIKLNANDPTFSNTKAEMYQRSISNVAFVMKPLFWRMCPFLFSSISTDFWLPPGYNP